MIKHFQQQEDELHRLQQQISKLLDDYNQLQKERQQQSIQSLSDPHREQESSFLSYSTISSFPSQSTNSVWRNVDGRKQYSSSIYTY